MQKYSVNQQLIETILASVKAGEIAIPEIQRPFVWDSSKVRDLMDSLYQGYPIGYLIAWRNPNVRLKCSRDYLKKNGLDRSKYNQIANYVYIQSEINIKIGNRPPKAYFDGGENKRLLFYVITDFTPSKQAYLIYIQ
jgi:uncharacterized protein with ParB-like and HNH nuclease domain